MSTDHYDDEHDDENLSATSNTEKSENGSDETDEDDPDRVAGLFSTASEDCRQETARPIISSKTWSRRIR